MAVPIDIHNVKDAEHLSFLARQVVEGFIIGLHKSPFHGFSVEFAEHRIHNPGDSTKHIDWKVYARTGKLFTKRFEEETNLRCQIIIDGSSSMNFPEASTLKTGLLNKKQFSIMAASALMNLMKKQRDAFGITIFDDHVHQHNRCRSSQTHYLSQLNQLEQLLSSTKVVKTNAAKSLHEVAEVIHKRSLVIIFSDMFDNVNEREALFDALQHLKYNKHEVVLFHVTDHKKEKEFQFENKPYKFVDTESGEEIKLQPSEVRDMYTEKINQYYEELRLKSMQYKIDFISADINEGFNKVLQTYLLKRSKMRV